MKRPSNQKIERRQPSPRSKVDENDTNVTIVNKSKGVTMTNRLKHFYHETLPTIPCHLHCKIMLKKVTTCKSKGVKHHHGHRRGM